MRILFLALALFLTAITLTPSANAAEQTDGPLVKIRLLPEKATVTGGETLWIATEQSITEHWHTYWKNPGDSGTAPAIHWTLPTGFEISDIHWPTPHKLPYGPLLNYGYEDQVVLLQQLQIPEQIPTGPITLTADVELLVCKEECIPEYANLDLILNGENASLEDNSAYIDAALKTLPTASDWPAMYNEDNGDFILKLTPTQDILNTINLASIELFPTDWGLVHNPAKAESFIQDGTLIIKQPRGDRALKDLKATSGVLAFETNDGQPQAQAFSAEFGPLKTAQTKTAPQQTDGLNVFSAIIFALLGGLILNLMPCVFPVLSIKALSLVKISEKHPKLARMHGISYTAGVIISFLAIAVTLIMLQAGGAQIGWGFQLQNPWIVGLLGYLLFIIGLNLIGFFEFSSRFANIGSQFTQNQGLSGSFFTGVLATLVATPCTAPFMAGAIGYAFLQPPIISLIIFTALGFGLALPYLTLSFIPALQKIMPKPGAWMEVFKQALAFPMFIAALWLLWVLAQQTDAHGITAALLGAIAIALGLWLLRQNPKTKTWQITARALAVISFITALALLPVCARPCAQPMGTELSHSFVSLPYSEEGLQTALDGDAPVFTEMTAAWCITCKVNHAIALNIDSTKQLMAKHNVQYFVGDWTNEDPEITKYLQKYGRNGVPLYVYYGPRDPVTKQRAGAKILPQVLTPAIVKDFIEGNTEH